MQTERTEGTIIEMPRRPVIDRDGVNGQSYLELYNYARRLNGVIEGYAIDMDDMRKRLKTAEETAARKDRYWRDEKRNRETAEKRLVWYRRAKIALGVAIPVAVIEWIVITALWWLSRGGLW